MICPNCGGTYIQMDTIDTEDDTVKDYFCKDCCRWWLENPEFVIASGGLVE